MSTDESRFEDRLLTAILDDFDHLTAPAARPGRRARRVAGPALIAAAVAVAVAVTATVGHSPARTHPPAAIHPVTRPVVRTAGYVVAHLRSALSANSDIVNTIDHAPDSQTGKPVVDEIWSTSLSHTYRITDLSHAGRPVTGYLVTVTAHRTVSIVINYRARTWTRTVYPFGSSSDARRPGPRRSTPLGLAAQLRAQVRAGTVTLIGPATVDGQRAIHLIQRSSTGAINLWVSPATYLPIREIDTARGVAQTSPQAIRDDYRWLPATPANLRLLTTAAAIPPGFRKTASSNGLGS
ncbi:MAG TPA: hypothetical protein VHU92_25780 [Streptosporangiaceae bacterium]|nr:hypothetical protein [Streptosporangiaceae bacterium]